MGCKGFHSKNWNHSFTCHDLLMGKPEPEGVTFTNQLMSRSTRWVQSELTLDRKAQSKRRGLMMTSVYKMWSSRTRSGHGPGQHVKAKKDLNLLRASCHNPCFPWVGIEANNKQPHTLTRPSSDAVALLPEISLCVHVAESKIRLGGCIAASVRVATRILGEISWGWWL